MLMLEESREHLLDHAVLRVIALGGGILHRRQAGKPWAHGKLRLAFLRAPAVCVVGNCP